MRYDTSSTVLVKGGMVRAEITNSPCLLPIEDETQLGVTEEDSRKGVELPGQKPEEEESNSSVIEDYMLTI